MSLLEVRDLTVTDPREGAAARPLVGGVSFSLDRGERLGLVGESGSGKSLTALSLLGLTPESLRATGSISFDGQELLGSADHRLRRLRGTRISMVFQEPMTALNPLMRVGKQISEVLTLHGASRADAKRRTAELIRDVGLAGVENLAQRYPHELSGGQRQRVLIAIALANDPDLLICDEPTTALDVTVQDQIVHLILDLTERSGAALLFVTHDLDLIAHTADRLLVMKDGGVVERGATGEILRTPQEPYTRGLVAASDLDARDHDGRLYTVTSAQDGSYRPGIALAEPRVPAAPDSPDTPPIIKLDDVTKRFRRRGSKPALEGVRLTVARGERLGLVGGSGSGKTTLLRTVARLTSPTSGTVSVAPGESVQMVFQDPMSSLDPRMTVAEAVAESLGTGMDRAARARRVRQVLDEVGIPAGAERRYPHEFSGGQRQRIAIARAIAPKPSIVCADEPVSALDVSVAAQVINLLTDLSLEYQLTLLFVSHDLHVVRQLCSRIAVLHEGRIVEQGAAADVYERPQHPYTQRLIEAIPRAIGRMPQPDPRL